MDLLKYIFDESKHKGFRGIISAIIKIAAFSTCISPAFIYFLLYQPTLFDTKFNDIISYALILGCSCILFLIIFACSTVYANVLLINKGKDLTGDDKKIEYYFKNSCIITIIAQLIISIFLVVIKFSNNLPDEFIEQLKELKILIIIIGLFIALSFIIRCFLLKQHNKKLEQYIKKLEQYIKELQMRAGNLDTGRTEASAGEDN